MLRGLADPLIGTAGELLVFLGIGVLAGAHCLGMCGPLVTTYADRIGERSEARRSDTLTPYVLRQHTLFNLGRALSYALIGALFGVLGWLAVGSVESVAAAGNTVRGVVGIVIGVLIVLVGVWYLRGRAGMSLSLPFMGTVMARLSRGIERVATGPGIFGLGAAHGVFPCPILYPAYLYAFATADPVRGGVALFVLGLGTIPTLFAYGALIGSMGTRTRVRLHRVLGVAFIGLGYIPLQHGLMMLGIVHLPHPPIPFFDPL